MKNTIFLPCAVNSDNVPMMAISNSDIRKDEYEFSIKQWIKVAKKYNLQLVICDSTGFDFSYLIGNSLSCANIEILSFYQTSRDYHRGKGYFEQLAFQFSFENSKLLVQSEMILKCNGRYFINNFERFFMDHVKVYEGYQTIGYLKKGFQWFDSRVFLFKPEFYIQYMTNEFLNIDDSSNYYFEHALSQAMLQCVVNNKGNNVFLPFRTSPKIVGASGTTGAKYGFLSTVRRRLFVKIQSFMFGK